GVMAEFETEQALLASAGQARARGYRKMDAYSPGPVEGLAEALGLPRTKLPGIMLIAGSSGAAGGYFLQYYAMVIDYPLNVGGRPLHSWPLFVPVTFELTILTAALVGMAAFLFMNRLPKPYHPVFNVPGFERATTDRYFLCIEAADPLFGLEETRRFLESLNPLHVMEVQA
ncbi:MAG: DUF3341 domain-containing protein, partial [Opitutales bacterium]